MKSLLLHYQHFYWKNWRAVLRRGPADHCQVRNLLTQFPISVNVDKLSQKCKNRTVQLAHSTYRSGSYVSTNQYEKYLCVGGWVSICAQHVQTFFCHYWINKAVCNNYVPSICVMVCVRSNLELTKVFRRICVGYLSTIKERLEHLRIWVSKMDLWINPPVDRKGERHSSCRMVVWDNMWTLT